ncbi:MAG: YHS domain-containing protein [Candidatus Levybacteria bacterium]|nr:YHS domain-containing protein [Candidatus Levybacteria bacterium]
MKINKKEAKFSLVHDGATHYFCSESCKGKFSNDPKKYSAKQNQAGGCCH